MSSSPSKTLLNLIDPLNSVVIFIDLQPAMTAGTTSIDRQTLINNNVGLAKAAKEFGVPVIITTVETVGFSGCKSILFI